ncbi:MAG TPA: PAS domain-containing sensor histidine kinase, partial [Ramlibacter sp.]
MAPAQLHLRVLEALAPPSLVADALLRILHLSPNAGRFLRHPGGDPTHHLLRCVLPDLAQPLEGLLQDAAVPSRWRSSLVPQVQLDGVARDVQLRVLPLHEDGTVTWLVQFDEAPVAAAPAPAPAPLTPEHGSVLEALRATEEQLRMVVENARDYAIFSIDLERRITTWNRGAERLLGYGGAEVVGETADVIFTAEDRAAGVPAEEAATALADGRASDDRVHVRKDGTTFWASGMCMLMRDGRGEAVGFVKILRDQTAERDSRQALETSQAELIQALADMQRARQQLEAADAAKDRFLAVLSHELRNPLASIASASELLLMPRLPEAALSKAAQVVQRQAQAMKVLLDELLDVSRLILGRLTLTKRPVSVAMVVQASLESTRPLVEAAGHQLVVTLPEGSVEVDGDPMRLAQVVSNLVSNAAKYTPEGGRIGVRAEVFHDEVVITVEDNGIGMDPSEIDTKSPRVLARPGPLRRVGPENVQHRKACQERHMGRGDSA